MCTDTCKLSTEEYDSGIPGILKRRGVLKSVQRSIMGKDVNILLHTLLCRLNYSMSMYYFYN